MKVLHVVNIYFVLPFYFGDQIRYLGERGHEIHIICSPSEYLESFAKNQGCFFAEIPILKSIDIKQDLISLIKIVKYIRKNDIDMVIGHTPKGALLSMLAAFIARVPKRIYFRHSLVFETMWGIKRKLMIFLDRVTAYCSTKVVCVSPSIAKKSIDYKLNKEAKQLIIGKGTCGGIDTKVKFNPLNIISSKKEELKKQLNIDDDDFIIGYSGRIVKDKGIVELIEAFYLLNKNNVKAKLLLVGDFEKRDSLTEKDISRIKNDPNIILTGFIFKDIQYYYSLMNIFILPSYREGFGMSVLEASSMEVPVFVTNVTGCKDAIVEGYTGCFIDRNPEVLKRSIYEAMHNNQIRQMGINGRKWVTQYFDHYVLWPLIEKEIYKD